jgi:hypothetical protein
MKKIVFLIIVAYLGVFVMSCSKENSTNQNKSINDNSIKLITLNDSGKTSITLLEFSNIEHYESTLANLESQLEQHQDDFLSTWGTLSEDAINEKEEEIGFVEHQPLIDFEIAYNIPTTLRQLFVIAEQQWLNQEELIIENSPKIIYPFGAAELTLLNSDGMVKIGNDVLQLTKNGFVQISNLDITTIIRIKNGDMTALDEPTVTTNLLEDGSKGTCTSWKAKDYEHYYSSNRKVVKHVHFHSYPLKGIGSSEITSYKKQGNKWKKYRMNLGVAVQIDFRNNDCVNSIMKFSGWKYKNAKSIEKNCTEWGNFPQFKAEKDLSVFGHYNYSGNSNINVLTW